MVYIIPEILFSCFILALFYAAQAIAKKQFKYLENKLFCAFCISSAIWSFGFFGVFMQTVPEKAYVWRAIGMVGTFSYLIIGIILICYLSGINQKLQNFFIGFSLTGIILYFFVIQKNQTTYTITERGINYTFTSSIWNTLYVAYTIIIALCMLGVSLYMHFKSPSKRIRTLGRKFFLTELTISFGMIFDTIVPLFNGRTFPGSSISQFLGLVVLSDAINFLNRSRINISNMSEYIYYSLTVPILVYDNKKHLQLVNDTAYSFLGIKKDNLNVIGMRSLFKYDKQDIFDFEDKSIDVDAVCCNNDLYCNLKVNKIHDEYNDVIGYIIIVNDLSEKMKAIENLEIAIKEAEDANRAKSIFLANMSHEIRTPMNVILGFSELILKMNIDNEVRRHVEDIVWSSHNLLAIINDILDISKIESGKIELVIDSYYTDALMTDIALIITPQAQKKNLQFNMKVDENLPIALNGDKTRIRSVIINILNNAVKYTQQGSISLEINVLKIIEDVVTIECKISDTGIGIKEEDLDALFETFERFDQKINHEVEGTGLGLSIAHGYIQLMGGSISVESVYGEGSTFTVIIDQEIVDYKPIGNRFEQRKLKHLEGSISNMKIRDIRVLVTDDNLINLRVAQGVLSYYGLKVDTAGSGAEAIEACRNNMYDFVFLDQMMPEMDGVETLNRIRKISSHYAYSGQCKIIVLTANAIKGTRDELIAKGFDEYLGKPLNFSQLEKLFWRYIPSELISYEESTDNPVDEAPAPSDDYWNYLTEVLKDMDLEYGIKNCGGKIDDYLKVLKITYEHGEKQLNELRAAWETQDMDYYIIKIHALKSSSLNIGARGISSAAKAQEEQGKSGNIDYIKNHKEQFYEEYEKLIENIRLVLKHYNLLEEGKSGGKPLMDDNVARSILINIKNCIKDFNFGQIYEILEEARKFRISDKYADTFANLEMYMDSLDVEEIELLLEAI